ncbi:hypothetical protein [Streptomyces lydicus]|uniref:hypothetical protein n=1 Tax=Streptomyces lydicus TaxID=47763 RepID=UPI00378996B6
MAAAMIDSARCAEQQLFGGVSHEQHFQLSRQMAGAFFVVASNGISHGLTHEVPGALAADFCGLSDGGTNGVAESEVQQDTALSVRVVAGQDIDGEHIVEPAAKYS